MLKKITRANCLRKILEREHVRKRQGESKESKGDGCRLYVCVCVWAKVCVGCGSTDAYMYWGNFIGIFLRSSREKLRKRFSAYFLMGNFTKRNIIQYCVWTCVCECVSVWVLYAPCVISWGRFLGTATWSVISVLGVSTAYSVFETLRLVAAACARISPKQIQ